MRSRVLLVVSLASVPSLALAWLALADGRWAPGASPTLAPGEPAAGAGAANGGTWLDAVPWLGSLARAAAPPPAVPAWPAPGEAESPTLFGGGTGAQQAANASAGVSTVYVMRGGAAIPADAAAAAQPTTGAVALAASTPVTSAAVQPADRFEACRSGAQGGGLDPTSGLWAWTCGNFNWHASLDASQATAVYAVDCAGLGAPDAACKRAGERLLVGVLHAAGVAADFTMPGGTVYWPLFSGKDHGIYVDRGAGLLADGVTRASVPPAEQLDVKALIGAARYAATGPSARRHAIQALNVRHLGEVTGTFELDDAGIPRRRGVWYVPDKGPHPDGDPTTGADVEDGPGANIEPATAALMVGSQRSFSGFNDINFCDDASATDPRCKRTTSGDAFAGRMHWEYGAMTTLTAITPGTSAQMCLSNFVGTSESLTTGTCPADRRMRCWATGATTLRSAGGCLWDVDGSGDPSAGDLDLSEGVGCQGFVDALEYDTAAKGRQLEVGVVFDNCVDDPRVPNDCGFGLGNHFRRASIQTFVTGACAPDARSFFVGTGRSQAFTAGTTLAEDLDATEGDVDLASVAGLAAGQSIRVDGELMRVLSIAGTTLTVSRGFSGTASAAHAIGTIVFSAATFSDSNTTWPPGYQVSGTEKVVAVSPARLLQAPGGFENVSIMPSDYRGSASCAAGNEAACDGTIGIAFNSGSGFYRNGTVLYPTFTSNEATFFDGSNFSERVLVEDLRLYGPTRSGTTFDLADNWTMRRAIVESGDPSSSVFLLSTFGDDITIEDSIFRNVTSTVLLKFGLIGPQRGLVVRGNKFIGNGGGGGEILNIGTASNFLIERNEFIGNAGVTPIKLNPVRSLSGSTTRTYLRNGTIRGNLFSGNELLANSGEDNRPGDSLDAAKAAILIRDDETVTNDSNEISNLSIYDNTLFAMAGPPPGGGTVAHEDYVCLVWLEQDDEPVSQMEESWPRIEIHGNTVEAGTGSRVVCAGDTDLSYRNASASISLFTSPFRPVTWGNVVNGSAEPGTRDLDYWNFQIETPTYGDEFLLAKLGDTLVPVSFDCVANGGAGLAYVVVALSECDAGGTACAPIGASATLTTLNANVSDNGFTDPVLDRGNWLKASVRLASWASPGMVSCSLGVTR